MEELLKGSAERTFQLILALSLVMFGIVCFLNPTSIKIVNVIEVENINRYFEPIYGIIAICFSFFTFFGSKLLKRAEKYI